MLGVFSSLWQAVGGSESREQFVASLQVLDAEQPGILPDQLWVEVAEASGTDLRCCLSATAGRQVGALVLEFPQGRGSKAKQLAPERLGYGGVPLGEVAGQRVENPFPGDVAAVLPLPEGMLRSPHRRCEGKALE